MIERTRAYLNKTVLFSAILCLSVGLTGCFESSGSKNPKVENTATVGDSHNRSTTDGSQVNQVGGTKASSTELQSTLSIKKDKCFDIQNKKLVKAYYYSRECWESGILTIPDGVEWTAGT